MALFDGIKKYFGLKPEAKAEAAKLKQFGKCEGVNEEDKKFLAKAFGNGRTSAKKPAVKPSVKKGSAKRKASSSSPAAKKAKPALRRRK